MTRGGETEVDDLIGTSVDRYRIARKLGEGGMGAVYLGEHASIGSRVAVKVLHPEYARRKAIVERFFAEAQAVNRIRHENIVQIVDLALLPDNRPYLIMEFLEGKPLSAHIERGKGLDVGLALAIAAQVADALAAAHEHRIVHRDLKPDNVFLVPRKRGAPRVKLLDFGIAKLLDEGDAHGGQTRTGAILGTPRYMSPEQAAGRTREIDWRSDVYSFGIILYEMLAGTVPFKAPAFGDLMLMHLNEPPAPPRSLRPELPPSLEAIVLRCLAKAPADRFQRMEEVAELLRAELQRLGVVGLLPEADTTGSGGGTIGLDSGAARSSAPASSPGTVTGAGAEVRAAPPPRTGRMVAIAAGVVTLVGIGGFVGFSTLLGGEAPDETERSAEDDEGDRAADEERGGGPKAARPKSAREPEPEPAEKTAGTPAGAPASAPVVPGADGAATGTAGPAAALRPASAGEAAASEDSAADPGKASAGKTKGAASKGKKTAPGTAHAKGKRPATSLDDSTLRPEL